MDRCESVSTHPPNEPPFCPISSLETKHDVGGTMGRVGNGAHERDPSPSSQRPIEYLEGFRFWMVTIVIALVFSIVNLEVTIVTTTLIAITDELGDFENVSWVMTSYLLGYVAVIVISAKFSDLFGRKTLFLISEATFVIASAACGASQTLTQLIVFRAFQGIGGSGCFSLCGIIVLELVPPEKYAQYVANMGITSFVALLLGPIIGGAISIGTTWRWAFLLNVPIGALAFICAAIAIPSGFPYHADRIPTNVRSTDKPAIKRLDIPGTILVLLAALSLTAGFTEAGSLFPWRSAYVIVLITAAGFLWISLLAWERHVTKASKFREPILPWRFLTDRRMSGNLIAWLFLGGPVIATLFILPQRFQLVYGLSGLDAGVRVIPFTSASAFGTIGAAVIVGKFNIPAIYMIFGSSALQVIGFALLGQIDTSPDIPAQMYVFQCIVGLGVGTTYTLLYLLIPCVIEARDRATAMGAAAQFRMMGSAIVLSIATSVFNSRVRHDLENTGLEIFGTMAVQDMNNLPLASQRALQSILAEGYNVQMIVLSISAAAQIPATALLWQKKQIRVS
ncbi:putative multidrug resistance protein fnx1 [Xylariomycetidae sp. FL2044]|nr:putative multidrug resistance protein fnx1 [Xylariomycetidae sp. FL2044]